MSKGYPVSKTQQMVLEALKLTAKDFTDADRIFANYGFTVTAKRDGKNTVPVIVMLPTEKAYSGLAYSEYADSNYDNGIEYKHIDLSPVAQWLQK